MGDMTVDELKDKKLWFLWSAKPGKNAVYHRNHKDGCRNKSIVNHRGCGTEVPGNH